MPFLSNFLFSYCFHFWNGYDCNPLLPTQHCRSKWTIYHKLLSFGCSWFYLLCNFLISFFLVLLIPHSNYLHNYTCSDLHYSAPRCIIKTSDPTQLHFNIDVNFSSSFKKEFIWIFPEEELFFLSFPQHAQNVDTLCCFCWVGLPYFTREPHILFFSPKNFMYEKQNLMTV